MALHRSQEQAIAHVRTLARARKDAARARSDEILRMSNATWATYDDALAMLRARGRVAVHFHPDRPDANGRSVAAGLLEAGAYRSQFETLLSNGHVGPFAGSPRDEWERRLFGGAYQLDGTTSAHRPKYAALDLFLAPDGPAPRFGSSYLLLRPSVLPRCTFTYLGSQESTLCGSWDELDDVMGALLFECFTRDAAAGERDIRPPQLLTHLRARLDEPIAARLERPLSRNLDQFVEAQVHGPIALADDVEALVTDPSFRGTPTGATMEQLCARHGVALHFHAGSRLAAAAVPSDVRGPTMPSLAARVARDGAIDARAIGEAAVALFGDPAAWADRGDHAAVVQELKLLWHVLVRCGHAWA
ncbi:MAG TPA: DUF3626 domain-containing protein [Polyangia bacterium]|nr:DUF3626 domain-containing protein [Polyangia bacterium]